MEEKTLKITYLTENTIPISENISLELLDIPPESIKHQQSDGNTALKPSLEYYKFQVMTCPIELNVGIAPRYYRFPEPIYCGAEYSRRFTLINYNNTDIPYKVKNFRKSDGV
jgi:hypothetical protein